jgi:diadenosine tetraphosphatase ApaH/serine/threonine PP2A family protein phosphatase
MKPRSARRVASPPPRAVIGAARTERARPVRFRLSVHSPRDQAIARWLDGIPLYSRAEAIRCALYDHLPGRVASPSAETSSRLAPSSIPPVAFPAAAQEQAATKLRRMF